MPEIGRTPEDYLAVKVADGKITRADADLLLEHLAEASSTQGLADHTIQSNLRYLSQAIEAMPGAAGWTAKTVISYIATVRKRYKANTQRKHIILTKRFCQWLVTNGRNNTIDIPKIKEVRPPAADRMTKTEVMMLRDDDIERIIKASRNTRDRCALSMLAESGMRPFELLDLRWGDLHIDSKGVVLNVAGKTGAPRRIRLVRSTPYITSWRNDHPAPADKHHIFTSLKGGNNHDRVTHTALNKVIRLAARRAGIKKHVNPYLFRHSNVTRMREEGYSDVTVCKIHWGRDYSPMLATYSHISDAAMDGEILDKAGIISTAKREPRKVDQCPRCQTILKPGDQFCPVCGLPQTDEAGQQVQTDEARLFEAFKKFMADQKK